MEPNKILNDLIINLKPKVIRFTGEKFPTELWDSSFQIKKNAKKSFFKYLIIFSGRYLFIFFYLVTIIP